MPPITGGDTKEYDRYQMADRYYAAQDQEKRRLEEYSTYRAYDDLRAMALTYVDQVLRYKFDAGDTSEGLREWLAQNHGIPNTRETRWIGDLVIKNVIYNKDVDTKQLISDSFGEYHFKHRNPMIDLRTVSEIEAARTREKEIAATTIKNNSSSLQQHQQGQQQKKNNNR